MPKHPHVSLRNTQEPSEIRAGLSRGIELSFELAASRTNRIVGPTETGSSRNFQPGRPWQGSSEELGWLFR